MQKVRYSDKVLIDALKARGEIFIYLGGAIQYLEDFGVDWRLVLSEAVSPPPMSCTTFAGSPASIARRKLSRTPSNGNWATEAIIKISSGASASIE